MFKRLLLGLAMIAALAACNTPAATTSPSAPTLESPSAPTLESPSAPTLESPSDSGLESIEPSESPSPS